MKTKHFIAVRGKHHEWCFDADVDPKHTAEMRADGIEIHELLNWVPMWVANARLNRPWLFIQDCFNFRNPFRA